MVNDRVLNWGLLSTAHINRALIPPLITSPRNRLAAVASREQSSADAYAREWKIPLALGKYEALLDNSEIDVIYISLPNHLHAEWSIKALRAGKHVLCEKPLGLTLDEIDAIIAASKETGKVLAEAFMYRHHPQTLKVKEMVDGDAIGKLQMIKGAFTFTLKQKDDIRLKKETGGGSIWDVGCYPISYARMVTGREPIEVFGQQVKGTTGVDVTFMGQLRFPDDVLAQFDCGFSSPNRSYIEIIGSSGILSIPKPFKPGLDENILLTQKDQTETKKITGQELYIGEVEDMADAVLLGKSPRVGLDDSRGNAATMLGLIKSAESGESVMLKGGAAGVTEGR